MRSLALIALAGTFVTGGQATTANGASVQVAPPSTSVALTGNWSLLELNGIPIRPAAVTLRLQPDGRFVATVYCIDARGLYVLQGDSLSFEGWDATERGCNADTEQVGAIRSALRGDGYKFRFDASGDLLLSGPASLRFRPSE